jgi:hypothetical protein
MGDPLQRIHKGAGAVVGGVHLGGGRDRCMWGEPGDKEGSRSGQYGARQ